METEPEQPELIPEEVEAEPILEPVPENTNLEKQQQRARPSLPSPEMPPQKKQRVSLPTKPLVSPHPYSTRKQIEAQFQDTIAAIYSQTDGFENTPLLEILGVFGEAEQIGLFCDDLGEPKAEIASFRWLDDMAPSQVEAIANSQLEENGFTVRAMGNYGGGRVYRVDRGEFWVYLNFAPVRAGSVDNGTLFVVWNVAPF